MNKINHCGIYAIFSNVDKRVYIGQSTNIPKRWYEHLRTLKLKKHHCLLLQRFYSKHKDVSFELLQHCKNEELGYLETYWWDTFNNLGYKLFNERPVKSAMDTSTRGKNISLAKRGKKATEKTRKILSKAQEKYEYTLKKDGITYTTKNLVTFCQEQKEHKISQGTLSECFNNPKKRGQHKGFYPVSVLNLDTGIISVYSGGGSNQV